MYSLQLGGHWTVPDSGTSLRGHSFQRRKHWNSFIHIHHVHVKSKANDKLCLFLGDHIIILKVMGPLQELNWPVQLVG